MASGGYDLPAFEKLTTLKTWAGGRAAEGNAEPLPQPAEHQVLSISASPAPPKVAQQIYTQATLTKHVRALSTRANPWRRRWAWAEGELRRLHAS